MSAPVWSFAKPTLNAAQQLPQTPAGEVAAVAAAVVAPVAAVVAAAVAEVVGARRQSAVVAVAGVAVVIPAAEAPLLLVGLCRRARRPEVAGQSNRLLPAAPALLAEGLLWPTGDEENLDD